MRDLNTQDKYVQEQDSNHGRLLQDNKVNKQEKFIKFYSTSQMLGGKGKEPGKMVLTFGHAIHDCGNRYSNCADSVALHT